jgi:hypothetical protein
LQRPRPSFGDGNEGEDMSDGDPGAHPTVDLDSAARSEPRAGRSIECAGGSYSDDNQDQVGGTVEPVVAADTQVRVAGIDAVHGRSGEDLHTQRP